VAAIGTLSFTGASIASLNAGVANITDLRVAGASVTSANLGTAVITTGNLTFSSTAQRITGDFSNATVASRLAFQTTTTNGATRLSVITNGTGTSSAINLINNSDPTNASWMSLASDAASCAIRSTIAGTGTYLPLTIDTGGSERVRIDTSGNVGIGTASPDARLDVDAGATALAARLQGTNSPYLSVLDNDNTVEAVVAADGSASATVFGSITNHAVQFRTNNSERMRIDSSGNVGIGGTAEAFNKLSVTGTLPSSGANSYGILTTATIPSSSTNLAVGISSGLSTQAASFTVGTLAHFYAYQGTIGSGSAITTQYGFIADSNLTGATNNFGFYSNIASGTNRWNFYANGTARNYFAGDTGIGTATISTTYGKLTVGGGITIADDQNAKFQIGRYSSGVANSYIKIGTNSNSLRISNAADTNDLFVFDNTGELIVGTTDNGAYNLQCNGTGVWGAGAYVNGSDARLKDNIATLNDGLNVVSQLRPVTFKYKPDYSKDQNVQTGFIAQELQAVLAGKDYVDGIVQAGPNHLNVAYQSLIPILVKAIQELTARVAELEAK
jgi:hypothetical protein